MIDVDLIFPEGSKKIKTISVPSVPQKGSCLYFYDKDELKQSYVVLYVDYIIVNDEFSLIQIGLDFND